MIWVSIASTASFFSSCSCSFAILTSNSSSYLGRFSFDMPSLVYISLFHAQINNFKNAPFMELVQGKYREHIQAYFLLILSNSAKRRVIPFLSDLRSGFLISFSTFSRASIIKPSAPRSSESPLLHRKNMFTFLRFDSHLV